MYVHCNVLHVAVCLQVVQQDEGVAGEGGSLPQSYLSCRLIMINCGSKSEIKFYKRMINGDMNVYLPHTHTRLPPPAIPISFA